MSFKNLISFEEIAENSSNFLDVETRPNWENLFGNRNPLNLEIGFGVGNFLIEMGIREPNENFIGIDFYHKGIRKVITRIDKHEMHNARIIYGDAKNKIPLLFNPEEVSNVYINFPDPWPKTKHHKRRLIKPDFIKVLTEKLKPNGEIHIATDHEAYAMEILYFLLWCWVINRNIALFGVAFYSGRFSVKKSYHSKYPSTWTIQFSEPFCQHSFDDAERI